jgi:lipid-A-disaccharide synthase
MSIKSSRFLIVAGEASGDIHGSGLVRALKKINPGCEFSGLGGNCMRKEGVKTFFDIDRMGAVGFVELLVDLPHYLKVYFKLAREIESGFYDAVILIDYPGIGPRTLKSLIDGGASVLALEAGRVMVVDQQRIVRMADQANISIVCI